MISEASQDRRLTEDLIALLHEKGAALTGIGDMTGVPGCSLPVGVSVAVPLPVYIVKDLQTGPTIEYRNMYRTLNEKLNSIVTAGEKFLKENGHNAFARTTDRVQISDDHISDLPHKTVATRAGLGWIGKNCLLITQEYGPAIRLSSLLTDAPLCTSEPIDQSQCGRCHLCVSACPGQALKGTLWNTAVNRDEIVDADKCYKTQRRIMKERTGIEIDLCGKCFAVCRFTLKYIRRTEKSSAGSAGGARSARS